MGLALKSRLELLEETASRSVRRTRAAHGRVRRRSAATSVVRKTPLAWPNLASLRAWMGERKTDAMGCATKTKNVARVGPAKGSLQSGSGCAEGGDAAREPSGKMRIATSVGLASARGTCRSGSAAGEGVERRIAAIAHPRRQGSAARVAVTTVNATTMRLGGTEALEKARQASEESGTGAAPESPLESAWMPRGFHVPAQ